MHIEPKFVFCHEADVAIVVDQVPVAPQEMVVGVGQRQTKGDHGDDGDAIHEHGRHLQHPLTIGQCELKPGDRREGYTHVGKLG